MLESHEGSFFPPGILDRAPEARFYTLGAAAYRDARTDNSLENVYRPLATHLRDLLMAKFGRLYEQIVMCLERYLGEQCFLSVENALPGFHIWLGHNIIQGQGGSIHFDLQFELIDPSASSTGADFRETDYISFTLPICLPAAGAGLDYWDLSYGEYVDCCRSGIDMSPSEAVRFRSKHFLPYKAGQMVWHSGLFLHSISPASSVIEFDARITLQGHGIRKRELGWTLYW